MATEDLLAYLKLEPEVFDDRTVHRSHRRNRKAGVLEQVETIWVRKERLGEGAFGQVWREQNRSPDGEQKARAVKVIKKAYMRKLQVDFKKELLALATFSKEEYRQADVLVSFLNWFETDDSVFLAMEYFQHGDLAAHISAISSEDEVRQITIDLLEGLNIMHRENFAHRDLKPQNIFVAEKPPQSARWWVKIGDFGISKRVKNEETALRTQTGTPYFQAPEIQGFVNCDDETSEYSNTVDIWSLGCVVYNISAQRVPFVRMSEINRFCHKRLQFPKEPLARVLGEAGIEFVERLLVPEPAQRMTINQGLQHPWILEVPPLPEVHHESSPIIRLGRLESRSNESPAATQLEHHQHSGEDYVILDRKGTFKPKSPLPVLHLGSTGPNRTTVSGAWGPRSVVGASAVESEHSVLRSARATTADNIFHPYSSVAGGVTSRYQDATSSYLQPLPPDPPTNSITPVVQSMATSSKLGEDPDMYQGTDWGDHWNDPIELPGRSAAIDRVAFSADGSLLSSALANGSIWLWRVATRQIYHKLPQDSLNAAFSPDGSLLAVTEWTGKTWFWDVGTKNIHNRLSSNVSYIFRMVFSPDGSLLALASGGHTIQLWRVATGQCYRKLSSSGYLTHALAFSPDGSLLVSGMFDDTILVWTVATGKLRHRLSGQENGVLSAVFSPDGLMLLTGSARGMIRLWDLTTKQVCREFEGHYSTVYTMVFSPDGTLFASASSGEFRLWDLATGQICRKLSVDSSCELAVAFSSDKVLVAAGSEDGTIRVWTAPIPTRLTSATSSSQTKDSTRNRHQERP